MLVATFVSDPHTLWLGDRDAQ
jgi:hypothetical protein